MSLLIRFAGICTTVGLSALCWASPAVASMTLGQLAAGNPPQANCGNGPVDQATVAVSSGPKYVVPAGGGVITSWSHNAAAGSGQMFEMKLFRNSSGSTILAVTHDGPRSLAAGVLNTFPVRIPVVGGEIVGANDTATATTHPSACDFHVSADAGNVFLSQMGDLGDGQSAVFMPVNDERTNISAVLEADADRDAFGDESQDGCPGVAGPVSGCPQADLSLTKSASPNPVPIHGILTYTLLVKNNGPSASAPSFATVTDTLPVGVSLRSATSAGGACAGTATVTCRLGSIAAGATATITVAVRANQTGPVSNTARVDYRGDTNSANDSASAPATVNPPPTVSAAKAVPSRFRLGSLLPKFSRAKTPAGTTVSFTLSEPAKVTLAFSQPKPGRKVKGRCVSPSGKNRHKPRCTRQAITGSLTFNGHAGKNKVRFQGRLSKKKRLRPGRYILTITATDSARNRSKPKSLSLTVLPSR